MTEIDKLQQAEHKLQEAINSQNAVFSAIPDLMFELDINGRYLKIWASNPQELAANKKELLGYTVQEKLPDIAGEEVMNAIIEAADTGNSFGRQIYLDTPSGKLWFELSVSRKDNTDLPNTFIVISRNITDRKLSEDKLEQLNERLTLALLGNEDGIWDWNLSDDSVYLSPRWKEMLGYKDNEIPNKFSEWEARAHKEDLAKVLDDIQEHINGKSEYVNNIHRLKHKDGHWVWIHDRAKAVFDKEGKAIRMIGTHTDITKQKEKEFKYKSQEEQLIQKSRMAQMGEMMSMIAHQWRQPLNAISTTAANMKFDITLKKYSIDRIEEQNEIFFNSLTNIEAYVHNLSTTIDDFRNFYRPDKKSTIIKLEDVIKKSLHIVQATLTGQTINIMEEYHDQQELEVYDNELMQVILSIMQNAQDNLIDYKIKNPYIKISTEYQTISISDNGGGIREDVIEKIFDPYFSTKDEKNGTGLGLYMSKTIIEKHHNGKLSVKNTDDGTCFSIELGDITELK